MYELTVSASEAEAASSEQDAKVCLGLCVGGKKEEDRERERERK
jgi:hypothetical protein